MNSRNVKYMKQIYFWTETRDFINIIITIFC